MNAFPSTTARESVLTPAERLAPANRWPCGPEDMALDIGPDTVAVFRERLLRARSVFWNGPMGLFEKAPFSHGSVGVAKAIAEAGINVSNPDEAGAKHGEVRIAFGDPDKKPTVYSVDQAPLTLAKAGKGAEITFQGKTKEGIQLRVTAKCSDVDEM